MTLSMSKHGADLLAEWEGSPNKVYKDVAGHETIGIGHLLTEEEKATGEIQIGDDFIVYSDGISDDLVTDLLMQDLQRFEEVVNNEVSVDLSQNQYDALVSFSFNVGTGAFRSSTLLRLLNQGQYEDVPTQLRRWNKSGGKVVQGLVNRREKEIELWLGLV